MTDGQADSRWVSAAEAARIYHISRAHWYVLASRKQFPTQIFNDGAKRYNVPNSFKREPNVAITVTNNRPDKQDDDKESLINQLSEAKEQLRNVEVTLLREQNDILQQDKDYLKDKLDEVQSQLPQILGMIGRLQESNNNNSQKIEALSVEKDKFKSLYEETNNMVDELRKERDEYKDVTLSIYNKFLDKKIK